MALPTESWFESISSDGLCRSTGYKKWQYPRIWPTRSRKNGKLTSTSSGDGQGAPERRPEMSKGAMSQLQKYIDFAVAKKTAKRARETGREK